MTLTITIDPAKIKEKMVRDGCAFPNGFGWSDSLLEALEELYDLETLVSNEFNKGK